MVKDIILTNKWQRPIYFAASCGDDSKIGLDDYLRLEGLAQRLIPVKKDLMDNVDSTLCNEYMLGPDVKPSKTYQAGFIIRSYNNPGVFLDENEEHISWGYRNSYLTLANFYANTDNKTKALQVMNTLEEKIPRSRFPLDYRILFNMANIYYKAGDLNTYREFASEIEKEAPQHSVLKSKAVAFAPRASTIWSIDIGYSGESNFVIALGRVSKQP